MTRATGPIRYVESKPIDWARMQHICEISSSRGQWANFGPVATRLEGLIAELSALPPEYAAVASSSGTAALYAAAGVFAEKAGRPLRWAISAFGFTATRTGPFAGLNTIIDCDDGGFLDIGKLKALPVQAWDGLLLTWPFGLERGIGDFVEICSAQGKPLIIDSALRFPGPRALGPDIIEILSLHHTKPWGFGEGGCLFVPAEDRDLARSMLNFGIGLPPSPQRYAGNGKISDVNAAAIMARLETMPDWSRLYLAQHERISRLAAEAGLRLLGMPGKQVIPASVPVLSASPCEAPRLPDGGFECGKYYRPLSGGNGNAERIFSHIVNIPCHGDMALVSDQQIRRTLMTIGNAG